MHGAGGTREREMEAEPTTLQFLKGLFHFDKINHQYLIHGVATYLRCNIKFKIVLRID